MRIRGWLMFGAAAVWSISGVRAQNPADHPEQYTAAEVAAGALIYGRACVNCHGPSGTGIGGIDLHRGRLPRAGNDAALRNVVSTGFPQAGMPAFTFSEDELRALIAYVRTGPDTSTDAPPVTPGDPARGRALVEGKGNCLSCHRIGEKGSFAGPELTEIGRPLNASGLIWRSLNEPTAGMKPINRPVRAVRKDGTAISGRRLNEDTYTVQLVADNGSLVGLVKSELKDWSVGLVSPMPSYKGKLTIAELADVLGYLVTLKGQ